MSYEEIISRCLSKVPAEIDKREGSIIFTALAPICLEISNAYQEIYNMLDLSYIETAHEKYLDMVCIPFGVKRNQAKKCLKRALIVTDIEIISEKFSAQQKIFIVKEKIDENIFIIEAENFGDEYNQISGKLTSILNILGIQSAEIIENYSLSNDQESDDNLRNRAINHIFSKPFAGNISDYIEKATSIDSVHFVKVFTASDMGEQNVHLLLLNSQKQPVLNQTLDMAKKLFKGDLDGLGLAPIGHQVSFSTCVLKDINISARIKVNSNLALENIKIKASKRVEDYINNLAFDTAQISVARVLSSILQDEQILDADLIEINDASINFNLSKTHQNFEIPRIVSISISEIKNI